MCPLIVQEAGNAPEHAKRLDGARGVGVAHVGGLPAELVKDGGHGPLCAVVIAADEHGWPSGFEMRIDELAVSDGAKGFDEVSGWKFVLQLLHQR